MYTTNFKQETIKCEHSTYVQQQISDCVEYLNRIPQNGAFKAVLLDTRENGYKRETNEVLKHTFGLHAMKKGTPLGGREIYFTMDINIIRTSKRGNVRLLGKFEENKCPQYKLIGIVDTHRRNDLPNLIDWKDLRIRNSKHWSYKNYIKVKVTKSSSVRYIAAKKIDTR